jgi:hypothetical protein
MNRDVWPKGDCGSFAVLCMDAAEGHRRRVVAKVNVFDGQRREFTFTHAGRQE